MNYSELFTKALKSYQEAPDKAGVFDSPYWTLIVDMVGESIRTDGTIDSLIKDDHMFFDYGICKELHPDPDSVAKSICNTALKNSPLPLITFSKWLTEQINKFKQCDKRDSLVKDLMMNKIQITKCQREITNLKNQRDTKLSSLVESSGFPNASSDYQRILGELEVIDETQLDSIRIKKSIAKGTFFSVEQKRENAQRENRLSKACDQFKTFLDSFQANETTTEIKQIVSNISELHQKIIETEQIIEKTESDLKAVEKQQSELSLIELENKIREEIEHIRDMTRLSAKRLHQDNCPVLVPEKKFLTYSKLIECIERILEFDPRIFKNDRVAVFGKPSILLVPGSGNALYDWKYNVVVVPLIYINDNPLTSISSGMIEYRLDTDEDKAVLNSYSQLPELKTIKSSLQIKAQLIKDYTTWMTSEYQGYRVLPKTAKEWFEHEIGPNKNDIFIPSAYQPFNYSASEFNALIKSINEKIDQKSIDGADVQDLWVGSILCYIQGNFQRSYTLLIALLKKDKSNPMFFYNFAQVASKLYNRSSAINGFSEFINHISQCWWTRVAGDHLRNLQSSGAAAK